MKKPKRSKSRVKQALDSIEGGKGGATKEQAKALKQEGFKVFARRINPKAPVGKMKSPTLRWVQQNLSAEQAGLILRAMRGKAPAQTWETKIPARPFLQIDKKQMRKIAKEELKVH